MHPQKLLHSTCCRPGMTVGGQLEEERLQIIWLRCRRTVGIVIFNPGGKVSDHVRMIEAGQVFNFAKDSLCHIQPKQTHFLDSVLLAVKLIANMVDRSIASSSKTLYLFEIFFVTAANLWTASWDPI
jgi:hypothetical protein